ncbi:LrgB family protein [Bradyrhizobium jicamae]|uniref:LrgB family protein n=1 Tax=Bradyrhizobium jicamae TaxID=280332 RepID=UPI0020119B10|nr:LrgB family protein [Bradyrhizobium jicamae]
MWLFILHAGELGSPKVNWRSPPYFPKALWADARLVLAVLVSIGIGIASALQINEVAGAFSGLGMGLNGALIAFLLPIIFRLF